MARPKAIPTQKMTADEFLVWAEAQEGKYELHDGFVVSMSPERVRHTRTKAEVWRTLDNAIRKVGKNCEAFTDGLTVRMNDSTTYEPDALVRCGEPLGGDTVEIVDPVIVVEVLSPSTSSTDYGQKLKDYFSLPSVAHYLVVDPEGRRVVHYTRQDDADTFLTRILAGGRLALDPPGIEILVDDVFSSLPPEEEPVRGGG